MGDPLTDPKVFSWQEIIGLAPYFHMILLVRFDMMISEKKDSLRKAIENDH